jgi:heme/copper-type cytochrome/quinol oxidase subunit 2
MELRREAESEFCAACPLVAFAIAIPVIILATLSVVTSDKLELTDRFEPRRCGRWWLPPPRRPMIGMG